MSVVQLMPIYGYGWIDDTSSSTREMPVPFAVRIVNSALKEWQGVVEQVDHEFDGLPITLSPRHTVWDGLVNVDLGHVQGYAEMVGLELPTD